MTTEITTDPTDVKRIIREYYEQFYANKFYILDYTGRFLEKQISKTTKRNRKC